MTERTCLAVFGSMFFPVESSLLLPSAVGSSELVEGQPDKHGVRRVNKVGRLAPSKSHVDPLAMQRLFDKPGLETVLEAMQFFCSKRMGHIGYTPAAFGNLKDDHLWLDDR